MNIYGILTNEGTHTDVSTTLKGAKQYATRNGYDTVSCRYNLGLIATKVAYKKGKKWINYTP